MRASELNRKWILHRIVNQDLKEYYLAWSKERLEHEKLHINPGTLHVLAVSMLKAANNAGVRVAFMSQGACCTTRGLETRANAWGSNIVIGLRT